MKTNLRVISILLTLLLAAGTMLDLPVFIIAYAADSGDNLGLAADSQQSVGFATQAVTAANAQTANYRAVLDNYERYGFQIATGEVFDPPDEVSFWVYDLYAPENDPQWLCVPVEWETGAYDSNVPGIYPVYITPEASFLNAQIPGLEETRVPLHVVDPDMPYLTRAIHANNEIQVDYYETIEVAREMRLCYSVDNGQSWSNVAEDFGLDINLDSAAVQNLDPDTVYWFRLEVVGGQTAGKSNILKVCLDPFADIEPDYEINVQLPPNNDEDGWIDGSVMSAAGLRALVSANDGGKVTLTGHVVWDNKDELRVNETTTVEMGDYSIIVPGFGARMMLDGPLHFTGSGTDAALFTVQSKGELIARNDVSITATGNNATAVRLNVNGRIAGNGHTLISVSGDNSTVIFADGGATLERMTVQASGEGSLGVRAAGAVRVFYSNITSSGASIESQKGQIVLDCAVVSPIPAKAVVINRTAIPYNNYELYDLERYGICVEPGETLNLPEELLFPLFDVDEANNVEAPELMLPVWWESPDYNPNVLGEHKLYFTPQKPRIPIKGIERTEIPLFIVDPAVPRLTHALRMGESSVILDFFREIEEAESLRLLYSTDEGKSWTDAHRDFAGMVTNRAAQVDDLDKDTVYWFRLEVIGGPMAGTSDVLKVWHSPFMDGGGQRDGTGQEGGASPSPNGSEPDMTPLLLNQSSGNKQNRPGFKREADTAGEKQSTIIAEALQSSLQSDTSKPYAKTEEVSSPLQSGASEPVVDQAFAAAETADAIPSEAKTEEPPLAVHTHTPLNVKASLLTVQVASMHEVSTSRKTEASAKSPVYPSFLFLGASVALAGGSVLLRRKNRFFYPMLLASVILASSAIFLYCRQYDNKYTFPRHTSGEGMTVLNQELYTQRPLLYLVDGWEFYGGKLLTPEEIGGAVPDKTLYLGQYGGFDLGDADAPRHGSATYRMTVYVGDEPRDYALELPEIFSSWQLWINGRLMQNVGQGDVDSAQTENWMATFTASDSVEIVVAVSDENGLYSGMVYPPAFGSPREVGKILTARLLIHGAAAAAALIIGILSMLVGFGYRFAKPYGGASLLCLCFAVYTSYPVIQALGLRGPMWAGAERLGYYGMFLLAIWLQGKLCALSKRLYYGIFAAGIFVCASVLLVALFPMQRAGAYYAYGRLLEGYQWLTAIYLLAAGVWAVWKQKPHSKALLFGLCVFGAALAVHRLPLLYEPVLLGWPTELAGFSLLLIVTGILWRDTVQTYYHSLRLSEEKRLADFQLAARKEHALLQQDYVRRTRKQLHETRTHLHVIRHYAEKQELPKQIAYVDDLLKDSGVSSKVYTGHELLDAILTVQLDKARSLDIYVEYNFDDIPAGLPVTDGDLASMLTNLLDNAVQGCERLPSAETKWLDLAITASDGLLRIECRNAAKPAENGLATSKADRMSHGYGLPIMREIVERYGGKVDLQRGEDCFSVTIQIKLDLSIAF